MLEQKINTWGLIRDERPFSDSIRHGHGAGKRQFRALLELGSYDIKAQHLVLDESVFGHVHASLATTRYMRCIHRQFYIDASTWFTMRRAIFWRPDTARGGLADCNKFGQNVYGLG